MSKVRRVYTAIHRSGTASGVIRARYMVGVGYSDGYQIDVVFPPGYGCGMDGMSAGYVRPASNGEGWRAWEDHPEHGYRLINDVFRSATDAVRAVTGITSYRPGLGVPL